MDLQGNPIPPGPRSTKVTNDPASNNPIVEPAGPVPNDSLAAESATHGGAFSQNRGAEPLGASAGESTLRKPNTTATTKLPSAPVGSAREDLDRQERYPEALGGQGDFPGAHLPTSGTYVGGNSASHHGSRQQQGTQASGSGYGDNEFPDDPKYNASFNSEIGSRNDPGRAAENRFQHTNFESGPDAGYPKQKPQIDNQQPYEALSRDQRA